MEELCYIRPRYRSILHLPREVLGPLACVHLSSEDEQKLKVAEFLDDCVERGVLHRCYARMLLRSIRKLKEEESAEGLKPSKKKTSVFPVKKIPMKVSQKNNYVCVKAPFKKASSSTAFVKTPPKQMTLSDDEL
ncbi:hypothetical protein QR680_011928 [Steinernema hermaphroditum]|uniref:Uncharacterized protein n=1 Tax=Steinernema hermaphroditum TaxID=289476 RepID=A0AA39I080_9BILA|nr:hypothetical protein QR680_011928 [Steinernema hermaphroditum]